MARVRHGAGGGESGKARIWAAADRARRCWRFRGLYLLAALVGSLVPVNRGWSEPDQGITIYLADNGVHADLVLPVARRRARLASAVLPRADVAAGAAPARAGSRSARASGAVYLDTPTWARHEAPDRVARR